MISNPFSCALVACRLTTSSNTSWNSNGIFSKASLPASSLEKSKMSLMMVRRLLADFSMVCR
ncbi:Uncharacterised protein [Vibrio cholerae]|nr:Uncharacterised protein [Vibrio cholerae]